MRLAIVVGTRPELIKMAPVYRALLAIEDVEVEVWLTGQHNGLGDAAVGLGVDSGDVYHLSHLDGAGNSIADWAGTTAVGVADVVDRVGGVDVDAVLVHGDTSSTLGGALGASMSGVPVVHVEAGLRTHAEEPWPEERIRRTVAQLADFHVAPTYLAAANLIREGVPSDRIEVLGNPGLDALREVSADGPQSPFLRVRPWDGPDERDGAARPDARRPWVLATLHRRENWARAGELARFVVDAVYLGNVNIADLLFDYDFGKPPTRETLSEVLRIERAHVEASPVTVFLAHHSTRASVEAAVGGLATVEVRDPVPHRELVGWLLDPALACVVTDSGGLQEECAALGVPCVVLRACTERPELVESGSTVLATDVSGVVGLEGLRRELARVTSGRWVARRPPPGELLRTAYGDGHSAPRIAQRVVERVRSGQLKRR